MPMKKKQTNQKPNKKINISDVEVSNLTRTLYDFTIKNNF